MMRKVILYFIPGILVGILLSYLFLFTSVNNIETLFTPEDGVEILNLIDSAEESIYIEVYIMSSDTIVTKLIEAENKGLDVKIILEKRMGGKNQEIFKELEDAGVDVRWATYDYKLTHSKIIIIDNSKVLVGSPNLSNSAMYENREAAVIIEGPIVNEFLQFFYEDWIMATS